MHRQNTSDKLVPASVSMVCRLFYSCHEPLRHGFASKESKGSNTLIGLTDFDGLVQSYSVAVNHSQHGWQTPAACKIYKMKFARSLVSTVHSPHWHEQRQCWVQMLRAPSWHLPPGAHSDTVGHCIRMWQGICQGMYKVALGGARWR